MYEPTARTIRCLQPESASLPLISNLAGSHMHLSPGTVVLSPFGDRLASISRSILSLAIFDLPVEPTAGTGTDHDARSGEDDGDGGLLHEEVLPDPANVPDRQELQDGAHMQAESDLVRYMDGARDAFASSCCTCQWDGCRVGQRL